MPVYICLLRGINVGGKRMKMSDLQTMFEQLGIADVQTLLASGNVVFQSTESREDLIPKIEAEIIEHFGFDSKIIMRTADELEELIAKNPFSMEHVESKFLHVMFLRDAPSNQTIDAFQTAHSTEEVVHVLGSEAFIHYVNGAGRSKLNLEKELAVIGTARNWNTVLKLQTLAAEKFNDK